MPPTAPRAPPRKKEIITNVFTFTPIRLAARGFSAQARMAFPMRVRSKKNQRANETTTNVPIIQSICGEKLAPRKEMLLIFVNVGAV